MPHKKWLPIDTAPKTDHPIWVRGLDYGRQGGTRHYLWAYWDGEQWVAAGVTGNILRYLTDWLSDAPGA